MQQGLLNICTCNNNIAVNNNTAFQGVPPLLSGFVCAYHSAAPGSSIRFVLILERRSFDSKVIY